MEQKNFKEPNWSELEGMSENRAEAYMFENWGHIPKEWMDPIFRDEVLGMIGGAELSAHMNNGEMAYGGKSRLGDEARGVWFRRNFDGQGHPGVDGWLDKEIES